MTVTVWMSERCVHFRYRALHLIKIRFLESQLQKLSIIQKSDDGNNYRWMEMLSLYSILSYKSFIDMW